MREHPEEAALNGRSEIGLAAITITMVDIVVFLPIGFMGGIVGSFFRQFGVTVATATAFSLLMSFTLTPMLASRWMKSEADKERDDEDTERRLRAGRLTFKDKSDIFAGRLFGGIERFLRALDHTYRGILEWALHNRFFTVVIGFVSLLVVFAMAIPLPKSGAGPAGMKMMMPRVTIARGDASHRNRDGHRPKKLEDRSGFRCARGDYCRDHISAVRVWFLPDGGPGPICNLDKDCAGHFAEADR